MAFKLVLFVAVCLAQGLAFNPLRALQRNTGCSNPSVSFATEVEQTVDELDALRDEVSMAAMEAYATGKDMRIAVACFVAQSPKYIKSGVVLARKMRHATLEIAEGLHGKVHKYAPRMEGPVKALVVTFTTVPVKVYDHIQNKQFLKAALVMLEARKIIKKNSIILAEIFAEMVSEVPEMAERVEFLAKDIYKTARDSSMEIREAYAKCVEEGGPKRPFEQAQEEAAQEEPAQEEPALEEPVQEEPAQEQPAQEQPSEE